MFSKYWYILIGLAITIFLVPLGSFLDIDLMTGSIAGVCIYLFLVTELIRDHRRIILFLCKTVRTQPN